MFTISPARMYIALLLTNSFHLSVLDIAANSPESLLRGQVPSEQLLNRLLKSNNNLAAELDKMVVLKCDSSLIAASVNKFHGAAISWMKNGKQMEFEWNRMSYKNHNIVINRAQDEDTGVYLCLVEYSDDKNDADIAELYALTVISNNTLLHTTVGHSEILTCHSTAIGLLFRGKSRQRWYRDGDIQRDYEHVSPGIVDNDTFLFTNTSMSGLWTCEVTANGNTWVTNRLTIEVKGSLLGFVFWPFVRAYKYHLIVVCVVISELVPILMLVLWILRKIDITATKKKYEDSLMKRWLEERKREETLLRTSSRKARKHRHKREKKKEKKQSKIVGVFVQYILLKSKKMEENLSRACGRFVEAVVQQGAAQAYADSVREKSTKLEKKLDNDVQKFVSRIEFNVHVDDFVESILATAQKLEKKLHGDVNQFSEGIVGREGRQQLQKTLNRQVDTFVEELVHGVTIGKYVSDMVDKSQGQKATQVIKETGNKESYETIKRRVGEIIKKLKKQRTDMASHEKDQQALGKVDDKAVNKLITGILKRLKMQETSSTDDKIERFIVDEIQDDTIRKYVAYILRKSKKQEEAQVNRAIQRDKAQDEAIGKCVGNILDKYKKCEAKRMEKEVDKFVDDIVQNEALRAHVLSQKQEKDPKVGDEHVREFVGDIIGRAKEQEEMRLDQEVKKFVNDRIFHETIRRYVGDVLSECKKQEAKRSSLEVESFVSSIIQDEAIKKYVGDILNNSRMRVKIPTNDNKKSAGRQF